MNFVAIHITARCSAHVGIAGLSMSIHPRWPQPSSDAGANANSRKIALGFQTSSRHCLPPSRAQLHSRQMPLSGGATASPALPSGSGVSTSSSSSVVALAQLILRAGLVPQHLRRRPFLQQVSYRALPAVSSASRPVWSFVSSSISSSFFPVLVPLLASLLVSFYLSLYFFLSFFFFSSFLFFPSSSSFSRISFAFAFDARYATSSIVFLVFLVFLIVFLLLRHPDIVGTSSRPRSPAGR